MLNSNLCLSGFCPGTPASSYKDILTLSLDMQTLLTKTWLTGTSKLPIDVNGCLAEIIKYSCS